MVNYIVNEVEVPAFPTVDTSKYPHALVLDVAALKTDDFNYDYTVIFCSDPFVYGIGLLDGEVVEMICRPTSSTVLAYACRTTSTSWTKVSLTSSGDTTVEYVAIPVGSTYIWTSHDIINKDTGEIQYKATELEQHIFAATPSVSFYTNTYYPHKRFIQYEYADTYGISAGASDSGVLTYQWYLIDEDGSEHAIEGATSQYFTPKTDYPGEYGFYCLVVNTYEEYTAQKASPVVTLTIVSVDEAYPGVRIAHMPATIGWITGKCFQLALLLDSKPDDASIINGLIEIFGGNVSITDNILEVE